MSDLSGVATSWALARAGFRGRRGLGGLAVTLALGMGVSLASLEAARRTERAYPSYLARAEVGELVVNPGLVTAQVEEVIASTPGLKSYTSHSLLLATPDDGDPRPRSVVESNPSQLLVSTDGRYVDQDRPVVRTGRMIRSGREAFVSVESSRELGLEVGDTLSLAFWSPSYSIPGVGDPSKVIEPIGRAEATVVGIGVFADEVLVDDLYPRRRILVTAEVASAFDCTPHAPPVDDTRSIDELVEVFVPPDCALAYRYYSLRVDGGDGGARSMADTLAVRFADENGRLPPVVRAADTEYFGYFVVPTFTADDRDAVQRSLEPAVAALRLFGVAAGATTLVVVLLVALRIARRDEDDARTWLHLGATRAQRRVGIALPLAAAGAAGLAGALLVGWVGSGIGPVASARSIEPAGRMELSGAVVVMALGTAAVFLSAAVALVATGATGSRTRSVPGGPWLGRAVPPVGGASFTVGVRAAMLSLGARSLLAASVATVVAVVTTVVFITSLNRFITDSGRFGWPYDAAVMVGFGYGGADKAAIAATLDRPDVAAWGLAALDSTSAVDGEPVPVIAALAGFAALPLPVIEGDLPEADDEIALGALTANRLGLDVGERALVTTPYGEREATVTGVVVLPTVGPFEADRTSLGTGALLSEQLSGSIMRDAEQQAGMEPGGLADGIASLVVVDLDNGVDSDAFLADISDGLRTWDSNGFYPYVFPEPVRPAPVADLAAMKAVPMALVGIIVLTMVVGLGLGIADATRTRRRELAVLRALGCVGQQLRASVRWHALCVVSFGLVVGIPIGLFFGRTSYRAFAEGLGFLPQPVVSAWWTFVIVVVALGIGCLASAGPARRAVRSPAAVVLHNE